MNNTYSLDQIQNTGGPDADLMRQYKLDKMVNIMEINSNNPELKQPEIARLSSKYHLLQYNDIEEKLLCSHLLGYHHQRTPIKQENKRRQTRTLMMLKWPQMTTIRPQKTSRWPQTN